MKCMIQGDRSLIREKDGQDGGVGGQTDPRKMNNERWKQKPNAGPFWWF